MSAPHPVQTLRSGGMEATIYLPDANDGFYRGTRFDWAGVIGSLKWEGHEFFGEWCERDPVGFQSITGPADEFLSAHDIFFGGPHYDEAPVGGSWPKVGVGMLEKDVDEPFVFWKTYPIADAGRREVEAGERSLEFTHVVEPQANGWGYRYRKSVELDPELPGFRLHYVFENTGSRRYDLEVYNHNFFQIDDTVVGPAYRLSFPFEVQTEKPPEGHLQVVGHEVRMSAPMGNGSFVEISGSREDANDHRFELKNLKTGASLRCSGTLPLHRMNLWACAGACCPEPYSRLLVETGEVKRWTRTYELFTSEIEGVHS
ncbi:MAG: hypothetical protein WA771_06265 [Chthoniobacterales bacterium]